MVESTVAEVAFLLARLLFGGVLAFMGVNHFGNVDEMAGDTRAKGLPAPRVAVLGSGALLVAGGLGIVLGVVPVRAAGGLAAFLLVVTVTMHDSWATLADGAREEPAQFPKNGSLAGGALALLAVGGRPGRTR